MSEYETTSTIHRIVCDDCGEEKPGSRGKHSGKATCTEAAICPTCGITYGDIDPDAHKPSGKWISDGEGHWQSCLNDGCEVPQNAYHCFGGNATCTDSAVCMVCKNSYGEPLDHVYDGVCDEKCNSCGGTREAEGTHVYENTCDTDCNVCHAKRATEHKYTDACDSTCDVCYAQRTPSEHTGGTATCEKKAVCSVCGSEYGENADHVYSTEWTQGASHHWHECVCGSKMNEASHDYAKTEIKNGERIKSCACGKSVTDPTYKEESSSPTVLKSTLIIAGIVIGGSVLVGIFSALKNKKKNK